jgi:hypothetical protein
MGTCSRVARERLGGRRAVTLVAATTAALAFGLSGGGAYAYFTSHGTGTGHASTGNLQTATIASVGSVTTQLLPGGSGDVAFNVANPNSFSVTLVGVSGNGAITVDAGHSGCTPSGNVTFTNQTPNLTITANQSAFPVDLVGSISMAASAPNACQGATFAVPLTLTVHK